MLSVSQAQEQLDFGLGSELIVKVACVFTQGTTRNNLFCKRAQQNSKSGLPWIGSHCPHSATDLN